MLCVPITCKYHVAGRGTVRCGRHGKESFNILLRVDYYINFLLLQASLQPVQIFQQGAEEEKAETARLVS